MDDFIEFLLPVIGAVLFIFVVIFFSVNIFSKNLTSTGERSGEIVKIASEGYFHKTTEVEIIKGSLNSGSGAFGSKFDFTISNPFLTKIAQQAANQGKEITVIYHSTLYCPLSSGNDNCNFADNIVLNKKG